MKSGREYEEFVYTHLKTFFSDADVRLDDKIRGAETGFDRQIDISIRISQGDDKFLIIVQCKDYPKHKADIKVLGEFASVIRDVGASKGILLCTAGFAVSNHRYALVNGIELLTIEDVNSERWSSAFKVPVVMTEKSVTFSTSPIITTTMQLAHLNPDPDSIPALSLDTQVRKSHRQAAIKTLLEQYVSEFGRDVLDGGDIDLSQQTDELELLENVWVPVKNLVVHFEVSTRHRLKTVEPDEYVEIRDHIADATLPTRFAFSTPLGVDESWTDITEAEAKSFPGLNIQIEQWL